MKKSTFALVALALSSVYATGCMSGGGGGGSAGGGGGGGVTINAGGNNSTLVANAVTCPAAPSGGSVSVAGTNVLPVKVGGNTYCSTNMPCASVTICQPGSTTNCQTISDILIDTGSFGLRVFSSAITSYSTSLLTPVTDGSSHPLAECAEFGSANMWGSVVLADVTLGGESTISSMPMQLVNASYQSIPSSSACHGSSVTGPTDSSSPFNGILGVGLQQYDYYGNYYYCSSGTCHSYSQSQSQEVVNPVIDIATDNNGVILKMPSLANDQATGATGALIFGIGTGSHGGNNTPGAVSVYPANAYGYLKTTFASQGLTESFIDSGSNMLYLPPSNLSECENGTICLAQTECFDANIQGSGNSWSTSITFRILGENDYLGSTYATDALAADGGATDTFDWGLPFFYGRTIYVGIYGKSSSLGTGPYWAF